LGAELGVVADPAAGESADDGPVKDLAPILGPGEQPSPDELATLAWDVLSDMARRDPGLAARMRERNIPPYWDDPGTPAPEPASKPSDGLAVGKR
jgi:hypothetical protein